MAEKTGKADDIPFQTQCLELVIVVYQNNVHVLNPDKKRNKLGMFLQETYHIVLKFDLI